MLNVFRAACQPVATGGRFHAVTHACYCSEIVERVARNLACLLLRVTIIGMNKLLGYLASLALVLIYSTPAKAYTVNDGDIITVSFHVTTSPRFNAPPIDTLYLVLYANSSGTAHSATASLFDGPLSLGGNTATFGTFPGFPFYFHWSGTESSFNQIGTTRIDDTHIRDGSIVGLITISFDGSFQFDTLSFGGGTGSGSGILGEAGIGPQIDSINISSASAVPEASTFLMMMLGLLGTAYVVLRGGTGAQGGQGIRGI